MKYHNVKTEVDGRIFDSKREAAYYVVYRNLQNKGEISNLQMQTKLDYIVDGKRIFSYRPDFEYDDKDGHHIVDVKGVITPIFKLKKKLIEAQHKVQIEIVY